eukprot:gene9189-9355_t
MAVFEPPSLCWISGTTFKHNSGPKDMEQLSATEQYMGAVLLSGSSNSNDAADGEAPTSSSQATAASCQIPRKGVVIVRSAFWGNSAAATLTSSGGALRIEHTWAAVLDSTFQGRAVVNPVLSPRQEQGLADPATGTAAVSAAAGGCLSAASSSLLLCNTTLAGCAAVKQGGAVDISFTSLVLHNVSLLRSSSTQLGGCLFSSSSFVLGSRIRAVSCTADRGGGLYLDTSQLALANSSISRCSSLSSGGAVLVTTCPKAVVSNSIINSNKGTEGGAFDASSSELVLVRTEVAHNHARQRGGGLVSYAIPGPSMNFTAVNCSIHHNTAGEENGGAIAVELASVLVQGSTLTANTGRQFGGALFADAANVTVLNSMLRSNSAMLGGALYVDGAGTSWLKVINSSISHNGGDRVIAGGSVYVTNGSLTLQASNISNSTADSSGGAIYVAHAAQVKLSGCQLSQNLARYGMGAAVHLTSSRLDISNTLLKNNQAMYAGAGILASGSTVQMSRCRFESNQALVGGAYANVNGGSVRSRGGCSWSNNTAMVGGAIMLHDMQADFQGDVFSNNSATTLPSSGSETVNFVTVKPVGVGGAIYQFKGRLHIVNSTFKNNQAASRLGQGGAVFCESAVAQVTNSILTGNWAAYAGGAIRLVSKQCPAVLQVSGSQLSSNAAQGFELPTCDEHGNGGALCVDLAGPLTIDANTTFLDNFAHLGGEE